MEKFLGGVLLWLGFFVFGQTAHANTPLALVEIAQACVQKGRTWYSPLALCLPEGATSPVGVWGHGLTTLFPNGKVIKNTTPSVGVLGPKSRVEELCLQQMGEGTPKEWVCRQIHWFFETLLQGEGPHVSWEYADFDNGSGANFPIFDGVIHHLPLLEGGYKSHFDVTYMPDEGQDYPGQPGRWANFGISRPMPTNQTSPIPIWEVGQGWALNFFGVHMKGIGDPGIWDVEVMWNGLDPRGIPKEFRWSVDMGTLAFTTTGTQEMDLPLLNKFMLPPGGRVPLQEAVQDSTRVRVLVLDSGNFPCLNGAGDGVVLVDWAGNPNAALYQAWPILPTGFGQTGASCLWDPDPDRTNMAAVCQALLQTLPNRAAVLCVNYPLDGLAYGSRQKVGDLIKRFDPQIVTCSLIGPYISKDLHQWAASYPEALVVVAAGNSGQDWNDDDVHRLGNTLCPPPPNTLWVASCLEGTQGQLAPWSSFGSLPNGAHVGLAAPGEIVTKVPAMKYANFLANVKILEKDFKGTSFSAPFVAGFCAQVAMETGLRGEALLQEVLGRCLPRLGQDPNPCLYLPKYISQKP